MVKFIAASENSRKYDYIEPNTEYKTLRRFRINSLDEKSVFSVGKGIWGFLDWAGEEVVEPTYTELNSFKEGLALAKKEDKYGYLDEKGREAISFIYDKATDFKNGVAKVQKSGVSFYIDYLGQKCKSKFEKKYKNIPIIPLVKKPIFWGNKKNAAIMFDQDKKTKFKTKAATDTNTTQAENDKIIEVFKAICDKFKEAGSSIEEMEPFIPYVFNCPDNIKLLTINLNDLKTMIKGPGDLKDDDMKTVKKILKGLYIDEPKITETEITKLYNKLKQKYFWTFLNGTLTLSDAQIEKPKQLIEDSSPPLNGGYSYIKIPDKLVIFKRFE